MRRPGKADSLDSEMNQTFCRAAHDRPARILPAAITHRKNAPPGVVGRRSGYALAPPGHPRQESHPDCRCRLTLIVAGHQIVADSRTALERLAAIARVMADAAADQHVNLT